MLKPPDQGRLNGVWTQWSSATGMTDSHLRPDGIVAVYGTISSVSTPNFAFIPARALPNNPFTYHREVWESSQGNLAVRGVPSGPTYIFQGYWRAALGYSGAEFSYEGRYPWPVLSSQQKALARLQGKISKSSVNLAQAYAERVQTVSMLSQSIARLARLALYIKSGKIQAANKFIRENVPGARKASVPRNFDMTPKEGAKLFSNLWLEYTFGWTPLVSDIYGSAEALARAHEPDRRLTFSAQAESNQVRFGQPFSAYSFGTMTFVERLDYSLSEKTRYQLSVVEDQTLTSQLAQVGLTNPALLAWELLPFSFVWDWLQPIGSYLEQLEYARGLTFDKGTVSTRQNASGLVRVVFVTEGAPTSYRLWAPTSPYPDVKIRMTRKTRTVLSNFPYMDFPAFQPSYGLKRAVTSLALLNQIFTGKKIPR